MHTIFIVFKKSNFERSYINKLKNWGVNWDIKNDLYVISYRNLFLTKDLIKLKISFAINFDIKNDYIVKNYIKNYEFEVEKLVINCIKKLFRKYDYKYIIEQKSSIKAELFIKVDEFLKKWWIKLKEIYFTESIIAWKASEKRVEEKNDWVISEPDYKFISTEDWKKLQNKTK